MGEVLACNVAELDAPLLGGETAVSLPPWERL